MDFEKIKKQEDLNEKIESKQEQVVIENNPNAELEKEEFQKLVSETESNDQQQLNEVREKIAGISAEDGHKGIEKSREEYQKMIEEVSKNVNGIVNQVLFNTISNIDLMHIDAIIENDERVALKNQSEVDLGMARTMLRKEIISNVKEEFNMTDVNWVNVEDLPYGEYLKYAEKLRTIYKEVDDRVENSPEHLLAIEKAKIEINKMVEKELEKIESTDPGRLENAVKGDREERRREITRKILVGVLAGAKLPFDIIAEVLSGIADTPSDKIPTLGINKWKTGGFAFSEDTKRKYGSK